MYIFAKNIDTGEIFEVLEMELYQGEVLFIEMMDSNGGVISEDQPEHYEYTMQQENEGGKDNK